MTSMTAPAKAVREPVLSAVDRISEILFGLLMALSFVGAVSVAQAGRAEFAPCSPLPWDATSPGASWTR